MLYLALIMICLMGISATAAERIGNDAGGSIETYVERFTRARDSGERIEVDGQCLSACTLVLAFVPRERICVTPKASFGFHAAWSPVSSGGAAVNPGATEAISKMYPQRVRQWIRANGGLGGKMIYLRGRALAALYPPCSPGLGRGAWTERVDTGKRSSSTVRSLLKRQRSRAISFSKSQSGIHN
jgi:hypothetical protein